MDYLISRRIAENALVLCLGNITTQTTGAIVNAANSAVGAESTGQSTAPAD